MFATDMVALLVALVASMWIVFGAYGPIGLSIPEGETLWPFVAFMAAGGSWVSRLA